MYLGFSFELFRSLVFFWKFCICPVFFMIEWFLIVSITLFKCTFAGYVVYFFIIISVSRNFCFIYYVPHLPLVQKGAIKFIYTITFYCFCFLFRDYFFVMHIDNCLHIFLAATTYFRIVFVEYFLIFTVVWKMFLN